jgi:hypothetical protein
MIGPIIRRHLHALDNERLDDAILLALQITFGAGIGKLEDKLGQAAEQKHGGAEDHQQTRSVAFFAGANCSRIIVAGLRPSAGVKSLRPGQLPRDGEKGNQH